MIACFLSNISAKYYKNPSMLSRVIAKNVGDVFLRHSVHSKPTKPTDNVHGDDSAKKLFWFAPRQRWANSIIKFKRRKLILNLKMPSSTRTVVRLKPLLMFDENCDSVGVHILPAKFLTYLFSHLLPYCIYLQLLLLLSRSCVPYHTMYADRWIKYENK